MTPIMEQLKKMEFLNPELIKQIKITISVENPSLSSKQKANLLAKIIHETIEEALPNFPKDINTSIRVKLLHQKVLANDFIINGNDVIETSRSLVPDEVLLAELVIWLEKKVIAEPSQIQLFLNSLKSLKEDVDQSEDVVFPVKPNVNGASTRSRVVRKIGPLLFACSIILFVSSYSGTGAQDVSKTHSVNSKPMEIIQVEENRVDNELPKNLQYVSINEERLQLWLRNRNSLLAEEPYFSSILEVADAYNIHPLLLFAITGQEQGFVNRDHKNASKIANNPFNVFHSWEDFNTNILDSSQIAARTIVNLSKNRPNHVNPIQWINRKYAEDPKWWIGVSSIFHMLKTEIN